MRELDIDADYRTRVGVDTRAFSEWFPGSALNTSIWTSPVTTMTITVTGGYVTLNAGLSTASGAVARLTSYQFFQIVKKKIGTAPSAGTIAHVIVICGYQE